MAVDFQGGYAGVQLRKAVFDRLHPFATTEYETLPIEEVFPVDHFEGEGKPHQAIVFTIFANDGAGTFWQGIKEIDTREKPKSGSWRDRPQTAEAFITDVTKAMGRALTNAGIPMKLATLEGHPPAHQRRRSTFSGDASPDDIDAPDAGASDDKTLAQIVAERVMDLDGPMRAILSRQAREIGCGNLYQAGEHAQEVLELIGALKPQEPEES